MEHLFWSGVTQACFVIMGYALYQGGLWIKNYLLHRLTVQLEIKSADDWAEWGWLEHFVNVKLGQKIHFWKPLSRLGEGLTASTIPIPLTFKFEGTRVRLTIHELPMVSDNNGSQTRYVANLWARHVDSLFFSRLLTEMKHMYQRRSRLSQLLSFHEQMKRWIDDIPLPLRTLDSLTLDPATKASILSDIETFVSADRRTFYQGRMPYRRGYLLTGPPGNGKSTFISVVAHMLKSNVARIALRQKTCDDATLSSMMRGPREADIPPQIFVLEDIDCLFQTRQSEEQPDKDKQREGVTFSGLLNALDGLGAAENAIIFMTTNHPERLDPALIRPGRVDKRVEFTPPTRERIIEYYIKFFPEESPTSLATLAFLQEAESSKEPLSYAMLQRLVQQELEK
jgi:chaperone BCS1